MAEINKINVNGTEYNIKPFEGNNYNMDPAHWQPKKVGKVLTTGSETKDLYMMQIMGTGTMSPGSTEITNITYKSSYPFDLIGATVYKIEGAFTTGTGQTGRQYVTSIIGIGLLQSGEIGTLLVSDSHLGEYIGQIASLDGSFYVTIYYHS